MGENLWVGSHNNSHPNHDAIRWFTPWFKKVKELADEMYFPADEKDFKPYFESGFSPEDAVQWEIDKRMRM